MQNKHEKFRAPADWYVNLPRKSQNLWALLLKRISTIKGSNKLAIDKAKANGTEPILRPIPLDYTFTQSDLMNIFGFTRDSIYKSVRPAAKDLRGINFFALIDRKKRRFKEINIFEFSDVIDTALEMRLTESGLAYLNKSIDERFVELNWDVYLSLSSKYSRWLFKLLYEKQYKGYCRSHIPLKEYKEHMFYDFEYINANGDTAKLPNGKHQRPDSFRNHAIIKAMKDILQKSNGLWIPVDNQGKGFKYTKTGKTITGIEFYLRYVKDPANMTPTFQHMLEPFPAQLVDLRGNRLTKETKRIIESFEVLELQILNTPHSERHTKEFKVICDAYGLMRRKKPTPPSLEIQKLILEVTGQDYFSAYVKKA